jgi:hypothetical protein
MKQTLLKIISTVSRKRAPSLIYRRIPAIMEHATVCSAVAE